MRSVIEPHVQDEPSFIEAARRKQIIDCAIDVIAELGFARASLAEIAKRAKVSKSVISYYFAGKDDLIHQVVVAIYTVGAEFMLPRFEGQVRSRNILRAYIESNIAFMGAKRTYMVALVEIFSGFRNEDGISKLDSSGDDPAKAHLVDMLRAGQTAGEFRDFDPEAMAFAIRAVIDMLAPTLSTQPDLDVERYAVELTEVFDLATRNERPISKTSKHMSKGASR